MQRGNEDVGSKRASTADPIHVHLWFLRIVPVSPGSIRGRVGIDHDVAIVYLELRMVRDLFGFEDACELRFALRRKGQGGLDVILVDTSVA